LYWFSYSTMWLANVNQCIIWIKYHFI
jgi:hypothetical protein